MRALSLAASVLLALTFILGSPRAGQSPVHAAGGCPELPLTLADLIALEAERGPLAEAYPPPVGFINERARACFGHTTLRFTAFVNRPDGLGGTSAYGMRPGWFFSASLFVFTTQNELDPGFGEGPFTGIYVPPGFGELQSKYARSWVSLTGHFMDSRASRCRATGVAGETPSQAEAIRICQSVFVLSSIGRQGAAPDTATAIDAWPSRPPSSHPGSIAVGLLAGAVAAAMWLRRGRTAAR